MWTGPTTEICEIGVGLRQDQQSPDHLSEFTRTLYNPPVQQPLRRHGKKSTHFGAGDSVGNGAFTQPVHFQKPIAIFRLVLAVRVIIVYYLVNEPS